MPQVNSIPTLQRISLIKFYRILQNARVTAFTVSELLMENQQGVGCVCVCGGGGGRGEGGKIIPPTQTRVRWLSVSFQDEKYIFEIHIMSASFVLI